MSLVGILANTGRGFVTGLADMADPIGYVIGKADYFVSGAGPAERERALPTFSNFMRQAMYKEPDKDVGFRDGYVPRVVGNFLGFAAGLYGYAALYAYGGPVLALAIPAILGIYGAGGAILRYGVELIEGERRGSSRHYTFEKAGILDGFKLGYHELTHLTLMKDIHSLEGDLSGRGLGTSHVYSSISTAAKPMRRNFGAVAGFVGGVVVGAAVNVLTLGIVPLYKTARDIYMNFKGKGVRRAV